MPGAQMISAMTSGSNGRAAAAEVGLAAVGEQQHDEQKAAGQAEKLAELAVAGVIGLGAPLGHGPHRLEVGRRLGKRRSPQLPPVAEHPAQPRPGGEQGHPAVS